MEPGAGVLLFLAGVAGSAVNAVAGGGTFFTFPALLAVGVPPVAANASNAVALWPGYILSALGFGREIASLKDRLLRSSLLALAGGLLGAWLLLHVGNTRFLQLVPLLLFFATLLFALGPKITAQVGPAGPLLGGVAELAIATYGGFFNAGLGILLMAGLALTGVQQLHQQNGLKNLLSAVINSVAVISFLLAGVVRWPETLAVLAGAVIGGYGGAVLARRIPARWLRQGVVGLGFLLSLYYAVRVYL
ncbi:MULTISPECIES: sulfite exporter TauE/SafE family protein [unclassified Meiothermus]|uniref:sulfite exporter TauE/SafE family protein n=1 Tax=unclassified Meiothermus TaxID=370471 RepID=UPI000D7C8E46|nr:MULTISPECIES: sulfite exporter TauE/SafE family protein [unclassified Meiothermus]PZA07151.1 sulfite exporter TauE/SafE family protein [Meiothermus sp. Pnk-1]RYM39967.1 sulfite exporter TauE/SafE family protein [Meiothermus sp. PNK-Is4]